MASRHGGVAKATHSTGVLPSFSLRRMEAIAAVPAPSECPSTMNRGFFFLSSNISTHLQILDACLSRSAWADFVMPRWALTPANSGRVLLRSSAAQSPSVSASFMLAVPRITKNTSLRACDSLMKNAGSWKVLFCTESWISCPIVLRVSTSSFLSVR